MRLGPLRLTLYTRWSPSPTLVLHVRLLARLLGDYYEAKQREQEQRRNAYMHAIYETGSRLTHDVKNLLQALSSLCAAVEASSEADAAALRRLLRRQLPQVTQRLQGTLDKLNRRPDAPPEEGCAQGWWRGLQQRYAHENVQFDSRDPLPEGALLPVDLFDSVAENVPAECNRQATLEPGIVHSSRARLARWPRAHDQRQRGCDRGAAHAPALPRARGLRAGVRDRVVPGRAAVHGQRLPAWAGEQRPR